MLMPVQFSYVWHTFYYTFDSFRRRCEPAAFWVQKHVRFALLRAPCPNKYNRASRPNTKKREAILNPHISRARTVSSVWRRGAFVRKNLGISPDFETSASFVNHHIVMEIVNILELGTKTRVVPQKRGF